MLVKTTFDAPPLLSLKEVIWVTRAVPASSHLQNSPRFKGYHSKFPQIPAGIRSELVYSIGSAPNNTMGQESEEDRRNREGSVDMLQGIILSFLKHKSQYLSNVKMHLP